MMRDLAKVLAVVGLAVLFTAIIAMSASTNQEKSDVITLPQPHTDGGMSIEKALQERRSRALLRSSSSPESSNA